MNQAQECFCEAIVAGLNQTEAAVLAGYSPRSAKVTGCRLIKRPLIRERIEKLKREQDEVWQISEKTKRLVFSAIDDETQPVPVRLKAAELADRFGLLKK